MKKVLVGSRAAHDYFGDDYYRKVDNSDYDYLVNLSENKFEQIKYEPIN